MKVFSHGADGHNGLLVAAELAIQSGYELTIDINGNVKASAPNPKRIFDIKLNVGVIACDFVLTKNGEEVLRLTADTFTNDDA